MKKSEKEKTAAIETKETEKDFGRRLYLLRHGKASKSKKDLRDAFRHLVRRGRKDVKKIRNLMIDRHIKPDLILCSPSVRTMETLIKLKKAFATTEVLFVDDLYMADADDILRILRRTAPDKRDVLVIGHNPGLQDFLPMVCEPDAEDDDLYAHRIVDGFPTSALACLEVSELWQNLGKRPVKLKEFIYSSDL